MQSALAVNLPSPKSRPRRKQAYSTATELQAILQKTILNPDTKPSDQAACARAWEVLEERKRILRGKPLPGHLRPELAHPRKSSKRVALLATMADEPPQPSTNPPPVDQPKESSSAS